MPAAGEREDDDVEQKMCKIFISGFDKGATEATLKAYFGRWGDIVKVVIVKDPVSKRSRRFGFITYAYKKMVDEAMSNRPHKIDGHEVDIKRALPSEVIENMPQQALRVKKLFVGGLKHLEEADLQKHFAQFGKIVSCDVITRKDRRTKRGFCFIEFDDTDSVDKVILHKKHEVKGVRLFVKKPIEWAEIKKLKDDFRSRGGFKEGRGRGGHGEGDYFNRRGGYRDDYECDRRGSLGVGGLLFSPRSDFLREDDMYDSCGGGGGRRGFMGCGYGGDSGYGSGIRYGGGPVRSRFKSKRHAPFGKSYPRY